MDCSVIVSKTDKRGIITCVNEAFCDISGYSQQELIGKPHNIVRHPLNPKRLFEELWSTILAGKSWKGRIKNQKKGGEFNNPIPPLRAEPLHLRNRPERAKNPIR
ncbi:MAG: PAS domain-containing protein [Wolinella sp.]